MKLKYLVYFFLIISCKHKPFHLTKITAKNININNNLESSSSIDSMVAPYKQKLAIQMEKVLTYSPTDLLKKNIQMQTTLGNLMADLSYEMANPLFKKQTKENIDFAMLNNGGIRTIISKGEVTKELAFKLMPFDNEFVVVELSGEKIVELIQFFIDSKRAHPLSKNINLQIKNTDFSLKINGKKFDKNKSYKVLTSDYLQGGGDKMVFFKNPKSLTKLNYKVRDGIIDYLKKVDTLKSVIDNRVTIK